MRMPFEIRVSAPMTVPAGVEQHGPAAETLGANRDLIDCATLRSIDPHDYAIEIRDGFEWQLREILPVLIPMERTIDVRPGVGDHLDLTNLEFRARSILAARSLTAEPIADQRRGQTFVRHHSVFNGVAHIYESFARHIAPFKTPLWYAAIFPRAWAIPW